MLKRVMTPSKGWTLPKLGFYGLSTVSFGTTMYGVAGLLDGNSWVGLVPAGTLTACVQSFLACWYSSVFNSWVPVQAADHRDAFACYLISVGFAYSLWWHRFRADDFAHEQLATDVRDLVAPVRVFAARYSDLADKLKELASQSDERARVEHAQGGTCGDASKSGPVDMSHYGCSLLLICYLLCKRRKNVFLSY